MITPPPGVRTYLACGYTDMRKGMSREIPSQSHLDHAATVILPPHSEVHRRHPTKVTFCVRGVVSPLLANLFLHYAFDLWMARTHPELPWCRYADDGLVHCRSELEAEAVMTALRLRLAECRLEMHPTKTKIVYCKDGRRTGSYANRGFDFLGYGFRPRLVKNSRRGSLFWSFTPAVSRAALTAMRETIRKSDVRNRTQITLADIARELNPALRGWIAYYGRYCPSALYPVFRHVNRTLVAWAMRKYKRLAGHKTRASLFLEAISRKSPRLFAHWQKGTVGAFA